MFKEEEDKLQKSGRKYKIIDYRRAELFCQKCNISLGIFDIVTTNMQTYLYCNDCASSFVKDCPFLLKEDIAVVEDYGNEIVLKYINHYYDEIKCTKVCYFNNKGRYIKIKGKTFYLNLNNSGDKKKG